jgi:hypothetical protein
MTMRAKNQGSSKLNEILRDSDIKKIEKDPNAYDAVLWMVVKPEAVAPVVDSHYEDDDIVVLDEIENEGELGEPELIVMVDMPNSVSHLILDAEGSEVTGGADEPFAVKMNKRNVSEGSAVMFKVNNSKGIEKAVFYSVHSVRATDNQGLSHIYYLMPFTGDSDELPTLA